MFSIIDTEIHINIHHAEILHHMYIKKGSFMENHIPSNSAGTVALSASEPSLWLVLRLRQDALITQLGNFFFYSC